MNDEQMNANDDHDKIFMEYFCHMDKILYHVEIYFCHVGIFNDNMAKFFLMLISNFMYSLVPF